MLPAVRALPPQEQLNQRKAKLGVQVLQQMPNTPDQRLLDALLDSWDRNNTILLNLLRALPQGGLEVRAMEGSPSVGELFTHIHFVRLVFVLEDAPEFARELPEEEWSFEPDRGRIAQMLNDSATAVQKAIKSTVETGRDMKVHYDHPILLLQHMLWHEGYHHGQIKLALKMAGCPITDQEAGPLTWDVWMRKH
ncbi:MAG: DinB family protein [Bryobacteraceae bacterium]